MIRRFVGQSEWFRANRRGKFSWDFLNHENTPLEEVDMSYTIINYRGLENLGTELKLSPFFKIPLSFKATCFFTCLLMSTIFSVQL